MDPQIAEYIQKQKEPQKEIMLKIRAIFKETLPDLEEKKAWGVITYAAGKFYLGALRDSVHVGFAIDGLSEKELELFEGTGKTMRHVKIKSIEGIDKEKLVALIQLVDKRAKCKPC